MQLARWEGSKLPIRLALFTAVALAPSTFFAQDAGTTTSGGGSSTLERIRAAGKITFGYFAEARPLSFRNNTGEADGYGVALCRLIAADVQAELKLSTLPVQFVGLEGSETVGAIKEGRVDMLCGPAIETLARRADVSFSIPVMDSGTSVMLRKDAPAAFRDVLEGRAAPGQPLWRGSPQVVALQQRTFAVVAGTSAENHIKEARDRLKINSIITSVPDVATGVRQVAEGKVDAFFGERTVLLDAIKRDASAEDIVLLDRYFDHAPLSFALGRSDEDFRLLVDKSLSHLYRSGKTAEVYAQYFGAPDQSTLDQFRRSALPDN